MNKKYYWIEYRMKPTFNSDVIEFTHNCVSDSHPFDWLEKVNKLSSTYIKSLKNWKEITKEEYEKGKNVIGIG